MRVVCIGGGPGGLYLAALLKRADPEHEVIVFERNRPDDTFGFGVVFSDQTLGNLEAADPVTYAAIEAAFAHWDDIDIHVKGQVITSTGHGFAGMSRQRLLGLLQQRCLDLGVDLRFEVAISSLEDLPPADLIVCADGVNSAFRDLLAPALRPSLDWRPNRFIWLGTDVEFGAFKFYFKENDAGLFWVHAYRYEPGASTFIVECTEATWRAAGLDKMGEAQSAAYCQALFAEELGGAKLVTNRSIWRQFPTVRCGRWSEGNAVILGDAAHTAHFSIGSGTKLAMEDAIDLATALKANATVPEALAAYELQRRPGTEAVQRAAQVSLEWFEHTERYHSHLEPLQFAFSLLTRSLRISHENLKMRDPALVERVDRAFEAQAASEVGFAVVPSAPRPPMFTPFKLRELVLPNRVVVSPMCQYSADDGVVGDWHLVHLGSRAIGGAGLVIAEMTDVSPDGRITTGCAGIYSDEHVAPWRRIVEFVHTHSEAKIGLQLGHAGRKASTHLPWAGGKALKGADAWQVVAPSALPYDARSPTPLALDDAALDQLVDDYVQATSRAAEAGFDLIELHAAHGYLLSTFISPLTNHRKDRWGGDLSGRVAFPLRVFDAIRAAWPAHKPISVRISATDWAQGGTCADEAVAIAAAFKAHGADIIDVSAGQVVSTQAPVYGRLFQTPFADKVRLEAAVPTITVGNISTFEDVNSILAAGRADLCAIARAHLYDPYWTRHAAASQGYGGQHWPDPYALMHTYKPRLP